MKLVGATKTISFALGTSTATISNSLGTATSQYCAAIDTKAFDYAAIDILLSPAASTSNPPTAITLAESDTTTKPTDNTKDIAPWRGGTATATNVDWVIPTASANVSTSVFNVYRFNVDLRPRKRYLFVNVVPAATGQWCQVHAHLGAPEGWPVASALAAGTNTNSMNTIVAIEG